MEDIDGGLHPAVDGQSLDEMRWDLLRTVCELTFSIKQMHYKTGTLWHSDASILFTSAEAVLDKRHSDAFILFTSAKVPPASAQVVLDESL